MLAVTVQPAGSMAGPALRVVVVVGTDHHRFDRLIGWVNDWLGRHPEQAAGCFVQSGTASVKPACPWSPFLDIDQLDALLDEADVMVCHGGPASIANAWSRGQVPIVVPRLRRLGEHVDDHQLDFCGKVAELGRVRLAQTPAAFAGLLEEAARDIRGFRTSGPEPAVDEVLARFAALVDELVSRPRRRLARARLVRQPRRALTTDSGFLAAAADLSPGFTPAASTTRNASSSPSCAGLAGMAKEEKE
jgi:UDP-N-acetylglucosamine transferase subunit ALG13